MKKKIQYIAILSLIMVGLYIPANYSQAPAYIATLTNDLQTSANVYEFDIYLLKTGTTTFELSQFQAGFAYDNSVKNGGTITATWVSGSQDQIFMTSGQNGNTLNAGTAGVIKMAGKFNNGSTEGNGAIIPETAPGAKYGRLRLTNSVPFSNAPLNLTWDFTLYGTKVNAWETDGISYNVTIQASHVSTLGNGTLPIELNSFKSNVGERQVNLIWSTKTEINSNRFEIERSLSGTKDATVVWKSVGVVQASGNSNVPKNYSYTEKDLQVGKYQYRLKLIDNNGSFKYSDVVESDIAVPKNFEVSQNYPNPFNPSTRINYSLPFDSKVTVEVYNITGERMGQIVNEEQSAGYYSVNFSSSSLYRSIASGVYIYRVSAVEKATGKSSSSIKKMMLLK